MHLSQSHAVALQACSPYPRSRGAYKFLSSLFFGWFKSAPCSKDGPPPHCAGGERRSLPLPALRCGFRPLLRDFRSHPFSRCLVFAVFLAAFRTVRDRIYRGFWVLPAGLELAWFLPLLTVRR